MVLFENHHGTLRMWLTEGLFFPLRLVLHRASRTTARVSRLRSVLICSGFEMVPFENHRGTLRMWSTEGLFVPLRLVLHGASRMTAARFKTKKRFVMLLFRNGSI